MKWRYYNHAMLPIAAPHETPDLTPINDGSVWKENKSALLARYTTDFDCGRETNWWYEIQDKPFDVSLVNAKRRYEINKGNKNFDVRVINPIDYADELLKITKAAYESWPEKYRPTVNEETWNVSGWNETFKVYGAFGKEDVVLHGYACLKIYEKYMGFSMLRVEPCMEKQGINAAVVYGLLIDNTDFISQGGYICDGERSIFHETAFQDYLEKYFNFRKAYCKLHIAYNPKIKWMVKFLYPFRKILKKADGISIFHKINGVLLMEELSRK